MMHFLLQTSAFHRYGAPIFGYIMPAVIFIISFVVTYLLYRHFTKEIEEVKKSGQVPPGKE